MMMLPYVTYENIIAVYSMLNCTCRTPCIATPATSMKRLVLKAMPCETMPFLLGITCTIHVDSTCGNPCHLEVPYPTNSSIHEQTSEYCMLQYIQYGHECLKRGGRSDSPSARLTCLSENLRIFLGKLPEALSACGMRNTNGITTHSGTHVVEHAGNDARLTNWRSGLHAFEWQNHVIWFNRLSAEQLKLFRNSKQLDSGQQVRMIGRGR